MRTAACVCTMSVVGSAVEPGTEMGVGIGAEVGAEVFIKGGDGGLDDGDPEERRSAKSTEVTRLPNRSVGPESGRSGLSSRKSDGVGVTSRSVGEQEGFRPLET